MRITAILCLTAALAWWFSAYDTNLTGEDKAADLKRRAVRSVITVVITGAGVGGALSGWKFGGFIFIAIVVPLAIIWAGCLSEFFAQATHGLIDSPDPTNCDPRKLARDLDKLATLVRHGLNEEAIQLCTALLKSRETSALAMDAMLFRIYEQMLSDQRLLASPVSAETDRLWQVGRSIDAESLLTQGLKREPENVIVAFTLLRLYGQYLRAPDKAYALLESLRQKAALPPGFLGYARHRLDQWVAPRQTERSAEGIESLLVRRKHPESPNQS